MPPALMMALRSRLGGGAMQPPGVMPQPAMQAGGAPTPMQLALFKRARAKKTGGITLKVPKIGA